jgi:hypothetical protein
MAAPNRSLNILTFVVALGFSVLLPERRVELREHSDSLAETLSSVSTELSENSGRAHRQRLTVDGLGWQRFHDARNPQTGAIPAFEKAVAQAAALCEQRDVLAPALATVDKIDRHQVETNPDRLRSTEYATELTTLLNDFEAINEARVDFEKTQAELTELQGLFEDRIVALDDSEQNVPNLKNTTNNLEADWGYWEARYRERLAFNAPAGPGVVPPAWLAAAGLDVNCDWNDIIIDMGAEGKLQPRTKMTVARSHQFVCSVRGSKVYDRYAVAEVLPKLRQGEALVGDRVLY